MEEHVVKIISIKQVTHDVKRFRVEKPSGYSFIPGQATEISVNTPELKNEKRPFTFTCLNKETFLKANIGDFKKKFYVCGPPPMMDAVMKQLANLGVGENSITLEL